MPVSKHRRKLTTWQVFRQVEWRFHCRDLNCQPLPWDSGISPPSSDSLRSSQTIDKCIVLVSKFQKPRGSFKGEPGKGWPIILVSTRISFVTVGVDKVCVYSNMKWCSQGHGYRRHGEIIVCEHTSHSSNTKALKYHNTFTTLALIKLI